MPGQAAKIIITEKQQDVLQTFARSHTAPKRLVQRAQIILWAFEGKRNLAIAQAVGLDRRQVGLWRRRWRDSFDALVAIECGEPAAALRRAVQEVLSDAPRSGAPGKFTAEQVASLLAVACEPPEKSQRPIDFWTSRELADEVVRRGVVESISVTQVGRYLAEAALWPHRSEYWLNTTEKDEAVFRQQVQAVCDCYQDAFRQYFQGHTHTVCVDEMTSLQALQRQADPLPMRPGEPERIEANYTRHGTLCLLGSWHVVLGQMLTPTIQATRTDEDFAWHIHNTSQTDPQAGWIFVLDNLNIHSSETLVRYVARLEGLDPQTLGAKRRRGVLKSVATRQAFLADASHRLRFVYLPKHASWLNQIETVFGIIRRRALRRGSFPSLAALRDRLLTFLDYFNRTFAKPFRWTYTGRPLTKAADHRPRTWKEKWASCRQSKETLALVT
jgi:transposase